MQFKDVIEGQMFYFPEDDNQYIKVKHLDTYIRTNSKASTYGGIAFDQFTNRERTRRNMVYEFEAMDVVRQVTITTN